MWISSAPLRISLGGGGTDLPAYARRFGGLALGATIDLRVTVVGRPSRTRQDIRGCLDTCSSTGNGGIANPYAREALHRHWDGSPLELASFADVPGGSGLGSSAAFCVAMIAGLSGGRHGPVALAKAATAIESDGLGRPVGAQDQYLSVHGGFTMLRFPPSGAVEVERIQVNPGFVHRLGEELLLFFTGRTRDAGEVLAHQHTRITRNDLAAERLLHGIKDLVPSSLDALKNRDTTALGRVLGQHWELKRRLSARVSLPQVDRAYADALEAGATGGKVLGAGCGGYLLLHVPPRSRADIRAVMSSHGFPEQPFDFDDVGAELLVVERQRAGRGGELVPMV